MTGADPCTCDAKCQHGQRCLAGHANCPDRHWYACETCNPRHATVYVLSDRRYLAVMTRCGHAVGPSVRARDLAVAGLEHRRTCGAETPGFTCPRCQLTSQHPGDDAEGYCGHCHDWTGQPRRG